MASLFKTPKAPVVKEQAVMPTVDDSAVAAQKKRALASLALRSGRQSTMIRDNTSSGTATTLGGN